MSNLVPERRINKNGVWTTKHVRATPPTKGTSIPPVPAPALPVAPQQAVSTVPYPCQQRAAYHQHFEFQFKPSGHLLDYLAEQSKAFAKGRGYEFHASDAEAYEVLSMVTPDDALPLLEYGVRSAAEAERVLREAGLEKLADDYSELTQAALLRGISAESFVACFADQWETFRDDPDGFLTLAQNRSDSALTSRITGGGSDTTFQKLIDSGEINVEHVRTVGVSRLYGAKDSDGALIDALKQMNDGTCLYTPEDLDRWISEFDLDYRESRYYDKKGVYYFAGRHGAGYVDDVLPKGLDIISFFTYAQLANRLGYDPEKERSFIEYARQLSSEHSRLTMDRAEYSDEDHRMLFESGISPKEAAERTVRGATVQQVIAMSAGNVEPGLSSGWL